MGFGFPFGTRSFEKFRLGNPFGFLSVERSRRFFGFHLGLLGPGDQLMTRLVLAEVGDGEISFLLSPFFVPSFGGGGGRGRE